MKLDSPERLLNIDKGPSTVCPCPVISDGGGAFLPLFCFWLDMIKNPFHASLLFLKVFFTMLWALAPIWGILAGMITCLGMVVGIFEKIGPVQGIYFAWVTATTVGYGDIVPIRPVSRLLSVVIGLTGIVNTGLIVTIAVTSGTQVLETLGIKAELAKKFQEKIQQVKRLDRQ